MAAAALRRAHPRPVAGRLLVGADQERRRLAAAPAAAAAAARRGRRCPTQPPVRTDDDAVARCSRAWRDRGGPSPEPADARRPGRRPAAAETSPALGVRALHPRPSTPTWRRTSYSSLSASGPRPVAAGGRQRARGGRPRTTRTLDGRPVAPRRGAATPAPTCRSPMADLPVGATFGSLVHAVLEHADPDAADLRAELLGHIDEQLRLVAGRRSTARSWPTRWSRCCDSPLGPAGRRAHAARHRRCATGCARWTSSCRWPAATCAAGGRRPARRPGPAAASATCPRATRCGRTPTPLDAARSAARRCAATSPARSTWCCACRRRRPALPRRRLQDQLARARATSR